MSIMGSFDYSEYEKFAKNLHEKLKKNSVEKLLIEVMNEVGKVAEVNIKMNTPVGQYEGGWVRFVTKDGEMVEFYASSPNRVGGYLRRGWKVTKAKIEGNKVSITLYNPVEYAEWVNSGHRIVRNGSTLGWVEGQFFLETTIDELREKLPLIIAPKYTEFLNDLFG